MLRFFYVKMIRRLLPAALLEENYQDVKEPVIG